MLQYLSVKLFGRSMTSKVQTNNIMQKLQIKKIWIVNQSWKKAWCVNTEINFNQLLPSSSP